MKSLVFHKDLLTSWVGVPWNRLVNDNLVSESNYSHISHNQQWILLDWRCSWRCLHKSNRNSCVIQEALKWIYLSSSVEGSGALTLLSLRHVPSFQSEASSRTRRSGHPQDLPDYFPRTESKVRRSWEEDSTSNTSFAVELTFSLCYDFSPCKKLVSKN